jgi:hypothetical protein
MKSLLATLVLRWALPLLPAALFTLGGCSSLNPADRTILAAHGVSVPLRTKMAHLAPLSLPDVVELSQRGMLPEYITAYIRGAHTIYHLTERDGFWLNHQGVNPTVVAFLFATPDLLARGSDRTALIDWPPYYFPFYSGSLNYYGNEWYLPEKSYVANSGATADPTLLKQQNDMQKILGKSPAY